MPGVPAVDLAALGDRESFQRDHERFEPDDVVPPGFAAVSLEPAEQVTGSLPHPDDRAGIVQQPVDARARLPDEIASVGPAGVVAGTAQAVQAVEGPDQLARLADGPDLGL